jgi:hypothetical protein
VLALSNSKKKNKVIKTVKGLFPLKRYLGGNTPSHFEHYAVPADPADLRCQPCDTVTPSCHPWSSRRVVSAGVNVVTSSAGIDCSGVSLFSLPVVGCKTKQSDNKLSSTATGVDVDGLHRLFR